MRKAYQNENNILKHFGQLGKKAPLNSAKDWATKAKKCNRQLDPDISAFNVEKSQWIHLSDNHGEKAAFPDRRGKVGASEKHLQMTEMKFCNQDAKLLLGVYVAVPRS